MGVSHCEKCFRHHQSWGCWVLCTPVLGNFATLLGAVLLSGKILRAWSLIMTVCGDMTCCVASNTSPQPSSVITLKRILSELVNESKFSKPMPGPER